MGCPKKVTIGYNVLFSICTHDPAKGPLTDADSPPIYRIYEDETATPILTGSMAKLDDAGTTGFYSELIACTIDNGFETRKTYTIYVEAIVDGKKGGFPYAFRTVGTPNEGEAIFKYKARPILEFKSRPILRMN